MSNAGRIDFFFCANWIGAAAYSRGKAHALVVNSAQRAAALPDVPTTLEAGFADAEYPIWFGLFLPARRRATSSTSFTERRLKALQTPRVRDRLSAMGVDPMVMTPSEFDAYVEGEIAVNAALVKAASAGVTPLDGTATGPFDAATQPR